MIVVLVADPKTGQAQFHIEGGQGSDAVLVMEAVCQQIKAQLASAGTPLIPAAPQIPPPSPQPRRSNVRETIVFP